MALHYRRNINCLSTNELHDLREAIATMFALVVAPTHRGPVRRGPSDEEVLPPSKSNFR